MISQKSKKIKYLTQSIYDDYVYSLQLEECTCFCGAKGRFQWHGTYSRYIKTPLGRYRVRIQRVKCKSCHHTHALMPESIIPYSHIVYADTVDLICAYEKGESYQLILNQNPELTEANLYRTIRNYRRHWRERLLSLFESITRLIFDRDDFLSTLSKCFQRCFMQIKSCFYGHT